MEFDGSFDVLIIGGGNAGISAAARLQRCGVIGIGIIEPQAVHTYRPLLSYVGGGQASMRAAERTQRSVTPKGVTWLQDAAVSLSAEHNTVYCASGRTYRYRDLVLAAGLVPDHDALPGIEEALRTPSVASNYLDHAPKTWELVQSLPAGRHAVFTVPRAPVSCTGTAIKPLFLAAAHWAGTGVRITLVIDRPGLVGVPELDARLRRRLDELGVDVRHSAAVTALQPQTRTLTINGTEQLGYDMLHLVPPFRGPQWVTDSGLAGPNHGLVDIDPETLRHRVFPDIWALGDGAAVATDPSGGALRPQVATLADNVVAARQGGQLRSYDGYTVAPITTEAHRLIAGEFDRSGAVTSSLPSFLDPLAPRRSAWAFDRYGLPRVYWNLILNGRV
jgi:sulfide:quinone oxidoreductase